MGNFWTMQIFPSYFFLTFFTKRCNLLKVKSKGRKKDLRKASGIKFESLFLYLTHINLSFHLFAYLCAIFHHRVSNTYEMVHQESLKKAACKACCPHLYRNPAHHDAGRRGYYYAESPLRQQCGCRRSSQPNYYAYLSCVRGH